MSTVTLPSSSRRGGDDAGHGLHPDAAFATQTLVADETGKGARAVAALFDFAAIAIKNAVAEIGAGHGRAFHNQDLVGAHAEAAVGQALPLGGAEVDLLVDGVDHDEIVARALHLGELEFHRISLMRQS
jgi:hypothetical protein